AGRVLARRIGPGSRTPGARASPSRSSTRRSAGWIRLCCWTCRSRPATAHSRNGWSRSPDVPRHRSFLLCTNATSCASSRHHSTQRGTTWQQPFHCTEVCMVTLAALWLPILVAAFVVFLASALLHMLLPLHKDDWATLPDEERARTALRGVPPGDYMVPRGEGMASM